MSHQLGANGIEELLRVVHKNAFKIGKLEVFSSRFELIIPFTALPIISSSHFPIISDAWSATYYVDATNGNDPSLLTIFHNL